MDEEDAGELLKNILGGGSGVEIPEKMWKELYRKNMLVLKETSARCAERLHKDIEANNYSSVPSIIASYKTALDSLSSLAQGWVNVELENPNTVKFMVNEAGELSAVPKDVFTEKDMQYLEKGKMPKNQTQYI